MPGRDAAPQGTAGLDGLEFFSLGDAAPDIEDDLPRVMPMGTSTRPVLLILPVRAKMAVPGLFLVPMALNQRAPLR